MSSADPEITHEDVFVSDGKVAGFHSEKLSGGIGFHRFKSDEPLTVLSGGDGLFLPRKRNSDVFLILRPSPDADWFVTLEDHLTSENIGESQLTLSAQAKVADKE